MNQVLSEYCPNLDCLKADYRCSSKELFKQVQPYLTSEWSFPFYPQSISLPHIQSYNLSPLNSYDCILTAVCVSFITFTTEQSGAQRTGEAHDPQSNTQVLLLYSILYINLLDFSVSLLGHLNSSAIICLKAWYPLAYGFDMKTCSN